jgi:tRNA nucleotidyltransferase/poly(A) polymerase
MNDEEKVLLGLKQHQDFHVVEELARVFHQNGFELSLVGGCVRDFLLGVGPEDLDLVSNAKPEEILQFYPDALQVGRKFGILKLKHPLLQGRTMEVATYREEDSYFDGRHPERVLWSNRQKDALRRDFTVNAMSFDLKSEKIFDFVGARSDLKARLLRAIGSPEKRFLEDHLRILRALRFAVHFGFQIETKTLHGLRATKDKVRSLSPERITEEVKKSLKIKSLKIVQAYQEMDLWRILIPSLNGVDSRRWPFEFKWNDFFVMLLGQLEVDAFDQEKHESNFGDLFPCFVFTKEEKRRIYSYLSFRREFSSANFSPSKVFLNFIKNKFELSWEIFEFDLDLQVQAHVHKFKSYLKSSGWSRDHFPMALLNGSDLVNEGFSGPEIQNLLDEALLLQIEKKVRSKKDLQMLMLARKQKRQI